VVGEEFLVSNPIQLRHQNHQRIQSNFKAGFLG